MHWLSHALSLSINSHLKDKHVGGDKRFFSRGFERVTINAHELADHISKGHAYAPVFNGRRSGANFIESGIISLDFDDADPDEVAANPIVKEFATLIYTTASHTTTAPRFRVIVGLEEPITLQDDYRKLTNLLVTRTGGDPMAKGPTQLFFGNSKAVPRLYDRGMSSARMSELMVDAQRASAIEGSQKWTASGRSQQTLDSEQLLKVAATGVLTPLSQLPKSTSVHCPVHSDKHASAFVVLGQSGGRGVHCTKCGLTFWSDHSASKPTSFETALRMSEEFSIRMDPFWEFWSPHSRALYEAIYPAATPIHGLQKADITFDEVKYVTPDLIAKKGAVTYVKSPKGSGKTKWLADQVSDPRHSVLLVGHRQALIRQMCIRLNIDCYLDEGADRRRFGVCLDSLAKVSPAEKYDYLVLDESEQVLAHFLSETMEDRRSDVLHRLSRLIANSKQVIFLDADLDWPSVRFASSALALDNHQRPSARIYINSPRSDAGVIRVFSSESHLVEVLHDCVAEGKRCFVTSNSKTQVDRLHAALNSRFSSKRLLKITSDNSRTEEIQRIIATISESILDYDVLLTSPSLSTGVDISFRNGEQLVDHVFGFFEPSITTHFECDQQISRVRNPRYLSVFVSPAVFAFDTTLDVVKENVLQGRLMEHFITGYSANGKPQRSVQDIEPLLDLACGIVSMQRASTNNLKENFILHKQQQGFRVELVSEKAQAGTGGELIEEGKWLEEEAYFNHMTGAVALPDDAYRALKARVEQNGTLTAVETWNFRRTTLERFYREDVNQDLLVLDKRGRLRDCIRALEDLYDWRKYRTLGYILDEKINQDPINRVVYRRHLRTRFLDQALNVTPVWNGTEFEPEIIVEKGMLSEFVRYIESHEIEFQNVFGETVRRDLVDKPTAQLSMLLGVVGHKLKKVRTRVLSGIKIYGYGWDKKQFELVETIRKKRLRSPDASDDGSVTDPPLSDPLPA